MPKNSRECFQENEGKTAYKLVQILNYTPVLWLSGATKELILAPCLGSFHKHILDENQADLKYSSWRYLFFSPYREGSDHFASSA